MTDFLIFQLQGPMAAWGEVAVGEDRGSRDDPGVSALSGLLAAALGVDRADEASHAALARGEAHPQLAQLPSLSEAISQIYFAPPHEVDARLADVLTAARAIAARAADGTLTLDDPDLETIAVLSGGPLLDGLEAAVTAYEAYGEAGLRWLRTLELISWISTLVLLGLLGVFILAPTVRRVKTTWGSASAKAPAAPGGG